MVFSAQEVGDGKRQDARQAVGSIPGTGGGFARGVLYLSDRRTGTAASGAAGCGLPKPPPPMGRGGSRVKGVRRGAPVTCTTPSRDPTNTAKCQPGRSRLQSVPAASDPEVASARARAWPFVVHRGEHPCLGLFAAVVERPSKTGWTWLRFPDSPPTSNGGPTASYWPHPTLTRRASPCTLLLVADRPRRQCGRHRDLAGTGLSLILTVGKARK